jgi:Ca2+-binding EF-hand superfamily protein
VAMGGNLDDSASYVDSDKLIELIENEFKLTIEIKKLIEEIDEDGSGKIEYGEFKDLLTNDGGNKEFEDFKDWFNADEDD